MKWISVKDQLPTNFDVDPHKQSGMLVYTKWGYYLATYHNGGWWNCASDDYAGGDGFEQEEVTHWMVLPAAPEG